MKRLMLVLLLAGGLGFCPQSAICQTWSELLALADSLLRAQNQDSAFVIVRLALDKTQPELGGSDSATVVVSRWIKEHYAYDRAETLELCVLSIRERTLGPEHQDLVVSLSDLAWSYFFRARYAEAEAYFRRILVIEEKTLGPDHPDLLGHLYLLAGVYGIQALYANAEPLYRRALAIQERNLGSNHPDLAVSLNGLAEVYFALARYADAEALYERALAIQEGAQSQVNEFQAHYSLSGLADVRFVQGRYVEAEELYKRALVLQEASRDSFRYLRKPEALNELGKFYYARARYAEAESIFKKAMESAANGDPSVSMYLTNLAAVYRSQARYADAEALYERALAISGEALAPNYAYLDFANTREARSTLYRCTRQLDLAVQEAAEVFRIRLRDFGNNAYVLSERDALTFSQATRSASDSYLSCFADIEALTSKQLNQACTAVLESKGIASEEILRRQQAFVTEKDPLTLSLVEKLRVTRLQMSKMYASRPVNDTTAGYRRMLDSLTHAADSLEAELSRHSASFQRRQSFKNVTIARIASALPANSSIVEYLKFNYLKLKPDSTITKYAAVVLKPTGAVNFKDLGKASTIDSLIGEYREHFVKLSEPGHLLSETDQGVYRAVASRLYELVCKPLLEDIPGNWTLLISPDGALNLVSFAGLVDDSGKYLIEKYNIHYLSAGRDVIRYADRTTSREGLFALGDPDFDASAVVRAAGTSAQQVSSTSPVNKYRLRNIRSGCGLLREQKAPPLPGTRSEIERIARNWERARREPILKYFGPDASEEHFKGEAKGHRVIHLATHGYFMGHECQPKVGPRVSGENEEFVGENPLLLSGLLLAGANLHGEGSDSAEVEDGILTALEISGIDFTGTDLVVLSACETGLGETVSGEGVYGLRRAFLMSGARTVVSSLWPVSDQATSELMERLYQKKAESLPDAIREYAIEKIAALRKRGAPDHPYYWAPFITIGDWRLN